MSASEDKTPEEIEAEIESTRDDLGDTVAELADRADVKKQTKKKASEAMDQAQAKVEDLKAKTGAKVEDLKAKGDEKLAEASADADPYGGTGGDIGSGPTGDVRNSPEIIDGGGPMNIGAVAGAFVAGLVIGWVLWH